MTPEQVYQRWYQRSPQGKAARARYRLSPKGQASAHRGYAKLRAKYLASDAGQAAQRRRLAKPPPLTRREQNARRNASPAGRAAKARYQASAKFKAAQARYYQRVLKPRRERTQLCTSS